MRWVFAKIYWFLLLTLIITGFAVVWITSSQSGSQWIISKLLEERSDNLQIENISGTLLHGISAESIQYENSAIKLKAVNFEGDYSLRSLVNKEVRIRNLKAENFSFIVKPKKEKSNKPPSLPEFSTPLPISVDSLKIKHLELNIKNKSYLLENVMTEVKIVEDKLLLTGLNTTFNKMEFSAETEVTFAAPFPIAATGSIELENQFSASQVKIDGELNHYKLSATADTSFGKAPLFSGDLLATGDLSGLKIQSMDLDSLNGKISGSGKLSWKDGLSAEIDFEGSDLNPGEYNKQFPGLVAVKGSYLLEKSKSTIKIDSNGKIRNYPLDINLDFSIQDSVTSIESAKAKIGRNRLEFKGKVYPEAIGVLDFTAQAPDLHALHPDITGEANIKGKMNGYLLKPVFDIQISGQGLEYQNNTSGSYQATISPGIFRDHYYFNVAANEVTAGPTHFESVKLDGKFSESTQSALVEISGGQFFSELKTVIKGDYNKSTASWHGQASSLEITEKTLSTYRSTNPAEIKISRGSQSISPLCIQQNKERLCLNGHTNPESKSRVDLKLTKFPFSKLKHWIPYAELLKESINAEVVIAGKDGIWTSETEIEFGENNKSTSKLSFNQLSHDINGSVDIKFSRMEWLNLFTDDVVSPKGNLAVNLLVSGTSHSPQVRGKIGLRNGFLRIPELGAEYSAISFDASFTPDMHAELTSSLTSGEGNMTVDGEIDLTDLPNWSAALKTSGNNFEAISIPLAKATVNPKLNVIADNSGITVTGLLGIPKANISLGDLSSTAVYPSSDEQIIGGVESDKSTKFPFNVNIQVELGKDVQISGFGLNSRLSGKINVKQKSGKPVEGDGSIQLEEGQYKAYGQKLDIERGDIYFNGPLKTPGLNMRATRKIEADDVTAGLKVSGTLEQPVSEVFSIPSLPETDALAYLLTGKPLSGLGEGDSSMLINAAARIGLKSSSGSIDKLRRKAGLDTFAIQAGQDISESALILGKFLTPELYIQYATKLFTESEIYSLKYRLSQKLHLEAESDDDNHSMDIIYQYER